MNLIKWLLTLPIRDNVRDKIQIEMNQNIFAIAYSLHDLVDLGKRSENLTMTLEECTSPTNFELSAAREQIDQLQARITKLELEWLHLSEIWGQYFPPTVTILDPETEDPPVGSEEWQINLAKENSRIVKEHHEGGG